MTSNSKNPMARNLVPGDVNDLQLQVRDLSAQLRDRKQDNVLLTTENARLKRQLYDLQQRIVTLESGRPSKRGEATTIGALRQATMVAKQQQVMAGQNIQQAMEQNQALMADNESLVQQANAQMAVLQGRIDDLEAQMTETQTGWKASREEIQQLQQQSDDLEEKGLRLLSQMDGLQAELKKAQDDLKTTQEELARERQVRSDAEGRVGQLDQQLGLTRSESTVKTSKLGQEKATVEQQLAAAQQESTNLSASLKAQELLSKDQASKAQSLQTQIDTLQDRLSKLLALTDIPPPSTLTTTHGNLLPTPSTTATGTTGALQRQASQLRNTTPPSQLSTTSAGAGTGADVPQIQGSSTIVADPNQNAVEIILHDVNLAPESAGVAKYDLWSLLVCEMPGMSRSVALVAPEPPSDASLPVGRRHVSEFQTATVLPVAGLGARTPTAGSASQRDETSQALDVLLSQRFVMELYNIKASALGGLRCPAPEGHPEAGQLINMIACASQHGPQVTAIHLFTIQSDTLEPIALAHTLSVDWRPILPANSPSPRADEFVVALRAIDPMVLESVRLSGLFTAGRSFNGIDNQPYQVWTAQEDKARKNATKKYLDKDMPVASDLSIAAKPFATSTVPLTSALVSPSTRSAHLDVIHHKLKDLPRPGLYDASPRNGTIDVTLRTVRDEQVGRCALTVRLIREIPMAGSVLQNMLPPVGDAGVGGPAAGPDAGVVAAAAPLGPTSWPMAMAAEAVGLWRMLTHLEELVTAAGVSLAGRLAIDPKDQDGCQQAMLQATDAVHVISSQLPGVWTSCSSVVGRADQASTTDGTLARAWYGDLKRLARRCGLRNLLSLRQRHLHVSTAHALSALLGFPSTPAPRPGAPSPPTLPLPSQQQLDMLASVEDAILQASQQLGWLPAATSPTAADAAAQFRLVSAILMADAGLATDGTTAGIATGADIANVTLNPSELTSQLVSSVQSTTGNTVASVLRRIEDCRKLIGGPAAEETQDPLELTQACQQQVANQLGQITLVIMKGGVDLGRCLGPSISAAIASALLTPLSSSQDQLQAVWAQMSKCEPVNLPPAGQMPDAWLKAAHRLSTQLSLTRSLWCSMWAFSCAQTLLVSGQRAAAVQLLLNATSADAIRVTQAAAAKLLELRSNRIYPTDVVQSCMEVIMGLITQHVVGVCDLVFRLATQVLVTPTTTHTYNHTGWSRPSAAGLHPAQWTLQTLQLSCLPEPPTPATSPTVDPSSISTGGAITTPTAVDGLVCFPHWQPKGVLLIVSAASSDPNAAAASQPATPARLSALGAATPPVTQPLVSSQGTSSVEEEAIRQAAACLGWKAVHVDEFRTTADGGRVPEGQVLAQACTGVDAAIVMMSRVEAGSAVQRLRALGTVVIEPQQDVGLRKALAVAVSGGQAGPPGALAAMAVTQGQVPPPSLAVQELARQLVARVGVAVLGQPAAGGQLTATVKGNVSGTATPAAAVSGGGAAVVSPMTTPSGGDATARAASAAGGAAGGVSQGDGLAQVAAVHTSFCADTSLSEPLRASSRTTSDKLSAALSALQSSTQNALPSNPNTDMVQRASQLVLQQQLQFEGLLLCPELFAAPIPTLEAALTPSRSFTENPMMSSLRGRGSQSGMVPPPLPPMQRKLSNTAAAPSTLSAAAAALLNQPVGVVPDDAASTASEDAEQYVVPVVPLSATRLPSQPGQGVVDTESDAASVKSTSTVGAMKTRQFR